MICILCRELGALSPEAEFDEKQLNILLEHSQIHHSQMEYIYAASAATEDHPITPDNHHHIAVTFARCFPVLAAIISANEIAEGLKKIKQRSRFKPSESSTPKGSIGEYCRRLIRENYAIEQKFFQCALCLRMQKLRHRDSSTVDIDSALSHALYHMKECRPYRCRYCDLNLNRQVEMCNHVKRKHKRSNGAAYHFVDSTGIYRGKICEMFRRCFGQKRGGKNRSVDVVAPPNDAGPSSQPPTAAAAAETAAIPPPFCFTRSRTRK